MKASKLALGAILGAAVGVAAGVLTAPRSGKETRDDIKRKAGETKDMAASKRDDLLFKTEEIADDVRAKATDAVNSVKSSMKK